jgi:hypothetical protein
MTTQLTKHLGDCTIHRSLINQSPEDGICTCGYGWSLVRRDADWSQMYSAERTAEMERLAAEKERRSRLISREYFDGGDENRDAIFVCRDGIEYEIEYGIPFSSNREQAGIDLTAWRKGGFEMVSLPHVNTEGQVEDLVRILKGGES